MMKSPFRRYGGCM